MALDKLTKIDGGGISTTSNYRVGIITATKFVGPIEGNVTGSITATDGTFSGNVTIGGTLTYEDVTNIDSVGIVTAREGIFLPDNKELKFGNTAASSDFRIYHNGSTNVLAGFTASDINIESYFGADVNIITNSNHYAIKCISNAQVELYHDNVKRLETRSGGVKITGGTDISMDGNGVGQLFITGNGYTGGIALDADAMHIYQNSSSKSLVLGTNETERLRITGGGNIGIGTESPNAPLQINNASPKIILEDNDNAADISIHNVGGAAVYSSAGDTLFQTANTSEKLRIKSNGSIQITPEGSTANPYMLIDTSGDSVRFIAKKSSGNNTLRFLTQSSGTEGERLRIASDGKVKICHVDSANPTEPLHVVATAVNQDIARFTGANKDRGLVISTSVSGSTNDSVINYNADSQNNVGQHVFKTDDNERLRITSAGEVKIKYAAAGQTVLSMEGLYDGGSNTSVDIATFARQGGAVKTAIRYNDPSTSMRFGTTTTHDFGLMTGGTERVHVSSTGQVGIGTNLTQDVLTLYDTDNNVGLYFQSPHTGSTGGDGFRIGRNDTHAFLWNYENQDIAFATNGSQHMVLRSTGQLGIGTVTTIPADAKKLTVICDGVGDGIHIGNKENLYPAGSTGYSDIRFSFYDYLTGGYTAGGEAIIRARSRNAYTNSRTTDLMFMTASDDGNPSSGDATEKLRLNTLGQLSLRGTTTGFSGTGDLDALQLYYNTNSGEASIGPYSSGGSTHLSFYTNASGNAATEKLTITHDGEVGIGTDNPDTLLEIYNRSTAGNTVLKVHNDKTGDAAQLRLEGGRTSLTDCAQVVFANRGNLVSAIIANSAADDGNLTFRTSASGSNSNVSTYGHIAKDGKIKFGKNAGGNPGARFHVEDDNTTAYNAAATTGSASLYLVNTGTNAPMGIILQNASTNATSTCQATIHSVPESTNKNTALTFGTRQESDATIRERLRITSGGFVGIGTDDPSAPLNVHKVNGTIAVFGDDRAGDNSTFECIKIKNDVTSYPAITCDSSNDTLDLRSMGSVQVTLDSNNNSTGKYFRVTTNGEGSAGTELFRVKDDGKVRVGSGNPTYPFEVYGSGQQTILIGSTNAGGAYLTLDGDSNGDGSGGDYSSVGHKADGDMQISTDNPNGTSHIIFQAGNSEEKLRIYATQGVRMETDKTQNATTGAWQNGVGYGQRTRIYPYWVSANGACRFNITMGPSTGVSTPRFWIFTNATNYLTGTIEIGANSRTNSPNNGQQRFHHSKWNVGMYGEGDNDFNSARWRDSQQTQRGNTIDTSGGVYYVHTSHSEYNTNANQYQNGYGGWFWHLDNGGYWQAQPLWFDMYFSAGGTSTWYAYIDD